MIGTIQASDEALKKEAQREWIILVEILPTWCHLWYHSNFDQIKWSSSTIAINEFIYGFNRALQSLRRVIFIETYHVLLIFVILNGFIDLLIKHLHEDRICPLSCITKDLISSFINSLGLIFSQCFIHKLLSDCITCEGDKFDSWLALQIRPELSLNKGALAHAWNPNRHNDKDSFVAGRWTIMYSLHRDLLLNRCRFFLFQRLLGRCILGNIIDLYLFLGLRVSSSPGWGTVACLNWLSNVLHDSLFQYRCWLILGHWDSPSFWLRFLRCGLSAGHRCSYDFGK